MATAKFQQLNGNIQTAISTALQSTLSLDQVIPFLVSVMYSAEYAKSNQITTCSPGDFFIKLYNAIANNYTNILASNDINYDTYSPNSTMTSSVATSNILAFFSKFNLPFLPSSNTLNIADYSDAIREFAESSPSDADFQIKLNNIPTNVIDTDNIIKILQNILGYQQYNAGNKPTLEQKLWDTANIIFNSQADAAKAIRPLKQYSFLSQFPATEPTTDSIIDEAQMIDTLDTIQKAAADQNNLNSLKKALKKPILEINATVDAIDSVLDAQSQSSGTTPPGGNQNGGQNNNQNGGQNNNQNGGQNNTINQTSNQNSLPNNSLNNQSSCYGLDPRAFNILQNMAIDQDQLNEALNVLAGDYYSVPFFTTYIPGGTETAAAQLLDNETEKASHRPFRVSAGEPGARKTVLIPPAFKEDKSQTIWSRAVVNNLGFPFINFSSPAVLALIKSSDPKEVKAAYKNVKSLFKECHLKRPIDTLKEFAKAKYRNSALNALAVQADELYNAESGMKVSASIIAPYTKNISLKGNVELPMDFLTAFYTVLSPVHATKQYTELCDMEVSEYLNYMSSTGKPPMYILNPKNLIFRRGPKAGLLHELFSSKTAPILVRTRVSGRDGGFMIPERVADKIFTT